MPTRVLRFLAGVLAVFLLAQPVPALAFASTDSAACCCKDKSAMCCRRSQHASGPAFSSRDCGGQCHISVRQSQPVAESLAPAALGTELAPALLPVLLRQPWIPSARHDAALFERPPPFTL